METFIGVSGQAEGIPQLPDGKFLPPMELNCVEQELKKVVKDKFGRLITIGRTAHATAPLPHSPQRGTCQYRNLCSRGCPYGGYFSSVSSTLPAAEKTGNMTLRPNSIVYELIFDEKKNKATGVKVLDGETGEQIEFFAKVIFLCASTFGSTFIIMNSISKRFPNGFGNDSGELGHNIMDHHLSVGANADVEGYRRQILVGRKRWGLYTPISQCWKRQEGLPAGLWLSGRCEPPGVGQPRGGIEHRRSVEECCVASQESGPSAWVALAKSFRITRTSLSQQGTERQIRTTYFDVRCNASRKRA